MGLFNRKKKVNEERSSEKNSIIKEYYGDMFPYIARYFASRIYDIPEVRTAVETFADIAATVPIYHILENKDGTAQYIDDDISYVLSLKPNALQNGVQFWKSVYTQLMLNSNIFIEPIFDTRGKLHHMYPLPLKHFEFTLEQNGGFVSFYDKPRGSIIEKYNMDNLIYLNRFSNLRGGESAKLGLYEQVIQALENQILKITDPKKIKALLQGTLGSTSNLKAEDSKGVMAGFKANLDANVDGIAYIDPQFKINAVDWQENDVNRDLMQSVINTVNNYFKISDSIIQHKATEIERETFIADSIKPITEQVEKELTYKLFTNEEIRAGHRIQLDVFALSVSTLQAKNALFGTAARNGILCPDEMREMLGQPALPNGKGKRYAVSADCVNIDVADQYQLGKVGKDTVSADKPSDGINNDKEESGQNGES